MSRTIGQFDFSVVKMGKNDLPMNPWVQINLSHWADVNGAPVVSAHVMTESEIDEHIQNLKEDLDSVRRRAKAALRVANEQTRALVNTRSPE